MGISSKSLGATLMLGLAAMASAPVHAACSPERAVVLGDFGRAGFAVTLADDPQERARGLMNVPQMAMMTGMLFVYEEPQHATFWMKNTLIPLDMLFIGADGTIGSIHENALPMDESMIDGGADVLAVLEINGGLAHRLGIAVGDRIQHPSFGSGAAVPCD